MEDYTSEQFNEFKAIGYPRSLSNRDLRGKNFEGFDLAGVNFEKSNLEV